MRSTVLALAALFLFALAPIAQAHPRAVIVTPPRVRVAPVIVAPQPIVFHSRAFVAPAFFSLPVHQPLVFTPSVPYVPTANIEFLLYR